MDRIEEINDIDKLVEKILDVKYYRGKKQYLVKWKNFDSINNTWEFLNSKIKFFEEEVTRFENEMKKKKVEAKGARGGTKTGKWYYVSSSEEEEEIKDKFWLNLDKGKVDLFQSSDMYSGIKDSKRISKPESNMTEKSRKSGGKSDPLMEAEIQISEDYLSETKRVTRSRIQPMIKQKKKRDRMAALKNSQSLNESQIMPNDEDNDDENEEFADDSSLDLSSFKNVTRSNDLFSDEASIESETEFVEKHSKPSKAIKKIKTNKNESTTNSELQTKIQGRPKYSMNEDSNEYREKLKHIDEIIEKVILDSRDWYEINYEMKSQSNTKVKSVTKESNKLENKEHSQEQVSKTEGDNVHNHNIDDTKIDPVSYDSRQDLQAIKITQDVNLKSNSAEQEIKHTNSDAHVKNISNKNEFLKDSDVDVSIKESDKNYDQQMMDSLITEFDEEDDEALSLPLKKRKSKSEKSNLKIQDVDIPEPQSPDEKKHNSGSVKSSEEKKELARIISQSLGKKNQEKIKKNGEQNGKKTDGKLCVETSKLEVEEEKKEEIKFTETLHDKYGEQMDSKWMRPMYESEGGKFEEDNFVSLDLGIEISHFPKWENEAEPSHHDVSTLKNDDLLLAVKNNNYLTVKFMTSHKTKFDLEQMDEKSGTTLIMIAARYGYNSILILLALNGANIEQKAKDGSTALTIACERGLHITVAILCQFHANINAPASNGETPLFKAVKNDHIDVVRVLLKYGANCGALLSGDRSIFHYSKVHAQPLITEVLLTHKSRLINELYKEAGRHLESTTKLDQVVFQPNIYRMSEGGIFNIHFRYELQSMKSNRGMLLFIGHYREGLHASQCSFQGISLVAKVLLNSVLLQPLTENGHFISTFAPLHDGSNTLTIHPVKIKQQNYQAHLVVCASLVSITT